MKTILILIGLFYQSISIAQDLTTPQTPKIEKCLHIIFHNMEEDSSDIFSFRFWNKGQIIDIRIHSDSIRTGMITHFIKQDSSSITKNQIISEYLQKINLSKSEIQQTLALIEKYKICDLPSSDSIQGWKHVLDGEWFKIEQRVNGIYSYKFYGNPKSQKNLPQAEIFNNFLTELNTSLNLGNRFWEFFDQLEMNCYTRNGENEILCKRKKSKSR